MSDQINDGSMVTGSRTITINTVQFATDDFSIDTDSKTNERTDGNEVLTGRKVTKGATTGTATLQLADSDTALPEFGDQFTETEGVFSITKVGRKETKGNETKVPISFVLNITEDVVVS